MARKSRFFKSNRPKREPLTDDSIKPSHTALFPKEELSSKPFLEEKPTGFFLDEDTPLSYLKDFFGPSEPQEPRVKPSFAAGLAKKRKLPKIFLISGGAIALLLLVLGTGNYLLTNSSSVRQSPTEITDKPIASPSDLSGKSQESTLLNTPPPLLIPAPEEKKISRPRSPAKKIKALSPPKLKKKPQEATNKKVGENAERVYELYINRKFILEETRAISLKLSLLGIENKIVKRKDGGYTIFAGTFKELSKAREVRDKVLDAGYRVGIYSVVKN